MRILFYCSASYYEYDLFLIFKEKSILYDTFSWSFKDKNNDDSFLSHMNRTYNMNHYDFVFSINYWPLLSVLCQEHSLPYISWCYDNPLNVRNIELTLGNPVNKLYCFDKKQAQGYIDAGFTNVYHLPLGINAKRLSKISVTSPQCNRYHAEVSFVGKLYESATDWILSHIDDYHKGFLQAVINAQSNLYGAYLIDQVITDEYMNDLNHVFIRDASIQEFTLKKEELIYALSCEVTRRERIILLTLCGSRFQTHFYSYNESSIINGVHKHSSVDYKTEMPYIFAASKINLNPSLCAIQTGIPLRALDIMGCGGFLLSNYQEELDELFCNGQDCVLYESMEDAIAKIRYYLSHEDIRSQIALNGRRRTFENHDMRDKLQFLFRDFV